MKNAVKVICFVIAVILIGTGAFYFAFREKKEDFEVTEGLKSGTVTISAYNGDSVNIIIPDKIKGKEVVGIESKAFGETDIESVKLNKYITSIGEECFFKCQNLESVDLCNVQALGDGCFSECPKLEKVFIPATVTKIGEKVFLNDTGLKEVTLESEENFKITDGVLYSSDMTTLYEALPYANLTTYTIPDSVTSVKAYSFCLQKDLKSITFGKNIRKIPEAMFLGCEALSEVKMNNTLTEIGILAFTKTNLTSITIPPSVNIIDENAFYNMEQTLTIKASANSKAEIFAKEKGFKYEIVK